ncbi:hypothetical protein GCM10028857_22920 [Salinarchaeum chitinilyticum]
MRRRDFVVGASAVTIAASTAGCFVVIDEILDRTDTTRRHRLVDPSRWTDRETSGSVATSRISGTVEIPAGYYATQSLEPEAPVEYHCEWETEGNPLDVLLMEEEEYDDRFRDAEVSEFLSSPSREGTTGGSVTEEIGDGEYVLVLSNSEKLGTRPDGTVVVDVTIETTYL